MKTIYLIEYSVYDTNGVEIKKGLMKVKNKANELEAKVSFEKYLRSQYPNFGKLIIHNCKSEQDIVGFITDLFGKYNK
jgi:hypothetical protein